MKKLFFTLLLAFILVPLVAGAQEETVNLYFFYGDGCPHCAKEEVFLDKLEREYDYIKIYRYETWHNNDNAKLLKQVGEKLGLRIPGVPILIIGDEPIIGYFSDEVTGKQIKDRINNLPEQGCTDIVSPLLSGEQAVVESSCTHACGDQGECEHDCGCEADLVSGGTTMPDKISLPFMGEVDVKAVSLPVLTFLIAAADGFNPCAMWVLLFLISMLLGMEDRKRMWILGSTFIVVSALVYFVVLAAWFNFFKLFGMLTWIRTLIALVALGTGVYHLYDWWLNRDGCKVTGSDKRRLVFEKIKTFIVKKSIFIALLGIGMLAAAVNVVELLCSAGLPAVYTELLALSNLPVWQYYAYLLFYILIFMLDDLVVFIIAMKTLELTVSDSKYTRHAGFIGGIIMIIIGILLIFKPGWLMFG
jgi:thiol-disulfide isomerase/thioredoxin